MATVVSVDFASPAVGERRALYRVGEAMVLLSLSKTVIYELMRSGRLRFVKQGETRLISWSAITEYVALLERESGRGVA
jgi:excisionase family DNA binding protein